jgi:nitroreductase
VCGSARRTLPCAARGGKMPPMDADDLQKTLHPLLARRSVSPKRLGAPAPGADELRAMLQAALRAPDHGGLHPWRVLEFAPAARAALAAAFEREKRRRDPLASPSDVDKARAHATQPPLLLGFVVCLHERSPVPQREQWLAAGAALANLLNAAHQLGYGASILSGERCFDAGLLAELGVQANEALAGFVSIGTVLQAPPPAKPVAVDEVWSEWAPARVRPPAWGG